MSLPQELKEVSQNRGLFGGVFELIRDPTLKFFASKGHHVELTKEGSLAKHTDAVESDFDIVIQPATEGGAMWQKRAERAEFEQLAATLKQVRGIHEASAGELAIHIKCQVPGGMADVDLVPQQNPWVVDPPLPIKPHDDEFKNKEHAQNAVRGIKNYARLRKIKNVAGYLIETRVLEQVRNGVDTEILLFLKVLAQANGFPPEFQQQAKADFSTMCKYKRGQLSDQDVQRLPAWMLYICKSDAWQPAT
mmetsp:Transcript_39703/g.99398  ORF Transcript_39703/g.99398 Transcript_39703/m.99398 type:complete len:249 (+) Transcript_39703:60-806(+)